MENQATVVTPEQAAQLLGISVNAVRVAVREKRIDARPATGILIPLEAVEEYRRRTQPDGVKRNGRPRKLEAVNA